MSKKKNANLHFQPLRHDEIELKNVLVEEARRLRTKSEFGEKLASAMIYASLSEYLAEHLLENLSFFVYKITYVNYAGIIGFDDRNNGEGKTLGTLTKLLRKYEFPDKAAIIKTLENVAYARNKLFHNLAKTTIKDFPKLEEYITDIQDGTEDFIDRINTIYAGLERILFPQDVQVPQSHNEDKMNKKSQK